MSTWTIVLFILGALSIGSAAAYFISVRPAESAILMAKKKLAFQKKVADSTLRAQMNELKNTWYSPDDYGSESERADKFENLSDSLVKEIAVKDSLLNAKPITKTAKVATTKTGTATTHKVYKAQKGKVILTPDNTALVFRSDSAALAGGVPAGYKMIVKPR